MGEPQGERDRRVLHRVDDVRIGGRLRSDQRDHPEALVPGLGEDAQPVPVAGHAVAGRRLLQRLLPPPGWLGVGVGLAGTRPRQQVAEPVLGRDRPAGERVQVAAMSSSSPSVAVI